jgi:hypothetical protein
MSQFGSAPGLEPGCRKFKSLCPDHFPFWDFMTTFFASNKFNETVKITSFLVFAVALIGACVFVVVDTILHPPVTNHDKAVMQTSEICGQKAQTLEFNEMNNYATFSCSSKDSLLRRIKVDILR